MGPLTVLPRCRTCGIDVAVAPTDAWLICGACGRADAIGHDDDPDGLKVCPLAARGYEGFQAIPFFRFPQPRLTRAGSAEVVLHPRMVSNVWVIAVRLRKFQGYGDVSYEYTRRPPRLEVGTPVPTRGAARTLADARRVARVVLHRVLADHRSLSVEALEVTFERPDLCCVPAQVEDGLVKFPHCPIRYPVELFEEARSLARANGATSETPGLPA